jgi:hypothetical protein
LAAAAVRGAGVFAGGGCVAGGCADAAGAFVGVCADVVATAAPSINTANKPFMVLTLLTRNYAKSVLNLFLILGAFMVVDGSGSSAGGQGA